MRLFVRATVLALGLAAAACGSEEGRKSTSDVIDDGRDGGVTGGAAGTAGTGANGGTAGSTAEGGSGGVAGTAGLGGEGGEGAMAGAGGVGATGGAAGAGGVGGAGGTAGATAFEGASAQGLMCSGGISKNSNYTLVLSTGEAPGGNRVMSSSRYRLQLGVTGATSP